MKHNRKVVSAVVAIVAIVAIGVMTVAVQAQAKSNAWKDFFSQDEATAIKKMVGNYIQDQLDSGKKDWKGIISGKAIDKGAIDASKVNSSIAKRKVYTGTFPASEAARDAISCVDNDPDECTYFVKISIPEINITSSDITECQCLHKIILYR